MTAETNDTIAQLLLNFSGIFASAKQLSWAVSE